MDFLDMFTDTEQFKTEGFEEDNLIRKILKKGDNSFRIVGRGKIYYTHQFDAKNGVGVRSICTKNEEGEGECPTCQVWNGAWKVLNDVKKAEGTEANHSYSDAIIKQARIITGDSINPRMDFKQSWGAKKNIALNVIDKDSRINEKENHTSLLAKSEYDRGISAGRRSIYETLVKLLTRHKDELKAHYSKGHDWLPFDTVLIKSGKGIDTDYDKEKGEVRDLTKAELAYERYDLSELTKPTDVAQVTKWLKEGTKTDGKQKDEAGTDEFAQKADEKPDDMMPPKEEVKNEKSEKETSKEEPQKEAKEESKKGGGGFKKKDPPKEEPKKDESGGNDEKDNCPTCDKLISTSVSKCPHCGEEFESYDADSTPF